MKSTLSLLLEIFSELSEFIVLRRFSFALVLILLINAVPFIGYFFFEWSPLAVFYLYWFESIIIGLYNLFKMVFVAFYLGVQNRSFKEFKSGIGFSAFFCVHFFGFCLVHLVFMPSVKQADDFSILDSEFLMSLGAVLFSHGYSMIRYFFFEKEYRQYHEKSIVFQMIPPYGRVVTLHLTLLLGNWFNIFEMNSSVTALVLLMAVKTIADLIAHYIEHRDVLAPDV